jgi:serine/threonine protein kinase
LGCVFYEMLLGRKAFDDDCTFGVLGRIFEKRGSPQGYLLTLPRAKYIGFFTKNALDNNFVRDEKCNTLLINMLEIDPTKRWTAKQCLDYINNI